MESHGHIARQGEGPAPSGNDRPLTVFHRSEVQARVLPDSHPWDRSVGKRILDLMIAIPSLVLFSPIMLLVALVIRLESSGPIVFRQERIGRDRRTGPVDRRLGLDRRIQSEDPKGPWDDPEPGDGDQGAWRVREDRRATTLHRRGARGDRRMQDRHGPGFDLYKFRTMRTDSDMYAESPTNGDDPRMTRIGKFLRQTCLDELPQLLNVLKGQMSIVGPRPEMPFLVAEYGSRERRRLEIRPGITGLWQIYGPRDRAIHETLELDLEYLRNQSFWLDLSIIIRTIGFMASRVNH